jgi:hypothetical protein
MDVPSSQYRNWYNSAGRSMLETSQPVEKVFHKTHQQTGTHYVSTIEVAELISKKE